MRKPVLPAALAAAFLLSACEPSENSATTTADGALTAAPGGEDSRVATLTAPGAQTGQNQGQEIIPQLPDFLPLYPGAKVTASFAVPDSTMNGGTVSFETSALPDEVIAFYKQKFTEQGMREALSAQSGDSMTYMATRDQTMVQVIASKGTTTTESVLSWSAPP